MGPRSLRLFQYTIKKLRERPTSMAGGRVVERLRCRLRQKFAAGFVRRRVRVCGERRWALAGQSLKKDARREQCAELGLMIAVGFVKRHIGSLRQRQIPCSVYRRHADAGLTG